MKRMVFSLFLIVCVWNSNPAFAAMAKPGGEKVIIGLPTTSMSMLPIFFAQEKGIFREEGLEPQLVFVGGRLQVPALAAGGVENSQASSATSRRDAQNEVLQSAVDM